MAKTSADLSVPFEINGRNVEASPTLVAQDFRWYHNEEDTRPLNPPVYHAGDNMFMKFDITGFKYGENNKVDVSYRPSLVLESGKILWTQEGDPPTEQSEAYLSQAVRRRRIRHFLE